MKYSKYKENSLYSIYPENSRRIGGMLQEPLLCESHKELISCLRNSIQLNMVLKVKRKHWREKKQYFILADQVPTSSAVWSGVGVGSWWLVFEDGTKRYYYLKSRVLISFTRDQERGSVFSVREKALRRFVYFGGWRYLYFRGKSGCSDLQGGSEVQLRRDSQLKGEKKGGQQDYYFFHFLFYFWVNSPSRKRG